MDFIGSIQYLGNKLSGRKFSQNKGKPAHKTGEKKDSAETPHCQEDSRLGQKLDTTA
ncbi:MAG: hypothetical protein WC208_09145 [Gallionella sp.]|jgi:hypothetical protein